MFNSHVALIESTARLGLALVLGSLIGFERQWHQKMAGLRTNALVALGSCGFVVFSSMVGEGDPTRIAAQVVTGIGFLGAGVILREVTFSTVTETYYTVTLTCRSSEEAHLRSLLLHALAQSGLGLRRMDSADIPDTNKVTVTAQAVAPKRIDAALEQIVGRLSLEPHITAATWAVDRTIPET